MAPGRIKLKGLTVTALSPKIIQNFYVPTFINLLKPIDKGAVICYNIREVKQTTTLKGDVFMNTCMYDPYDQCFGDCPNCPRANYEDNYDTDLERDLYNERED